MLNLFFGIDCSLTVFQLSKCLSLRIFVIEEGKFGQVQDFNIYKTRCGLLLSLEHLLVIRHQNVTQLDLLVSTEYLVKNSKRKDKRWLTATLRVKIVFQK